MPPLEADESNPDPHCFSSDPSNIIFPRMSGSRKWSLPFTFPD